MLTYKNQYAQQRNVLVNSRQNPLKSLDQLKNLSPTSYNYKVHVHGVNNKFRDRYLAIQKLYKGMLPKCRIMQFN